MGGRCFRKNQTLIEETNLETVKSLPTIQITTYNENQTIEQNSKPTEEGQSNPKHIITTPIKKRKKKKKARQVISDNIPESNIIQNYKPEPKMYINTKEITEEYKNFQQKTMKLFEGFTANTPKKKNKKKKQSKKTKESIHTKLPVINSGTKQNSETESQCSSYAEDNTEEILEPKNRIQTETNIKENKGQYKNVYYIKEVISSTFMNKFNNEIIHELDNCHDYYDKIFPYCDKIRIHIQNIAQSVFPCILIIILAYEVFTVLYGSMTTGLVYESSDLDLAICGLPLIEKEDLLYCIDQLADKLKEDASVISYQSISTARVPIIKLVYSFNN